MPGWRMQRWEGARGLLLVLILAPLAFILANFIVYWSGWNTVSLLMAVLLIG